MPNPLLQIDTLTKSFGSRVLFNNISFGIAEGDKIGLIAKNGAGKTTLLDIISGKEPYDSGRVVFRNDIKVASLSQDPTFDPSSTVIDACFKSDNHITKLIAKYETALLRNDVGVLSDLFPEMDLYKAWDYELRVKQILGQLKITRLDQPISELSGGQVKRIALANALISESDLLILDEPTNHLDLDMTEWLEEYLSYSGVSLLMVTHDRYFLDNVCSQIIEIDEQQIYQYKGSYGYYLEKREERIQTQKAETDKARNLYRKELDWMRRQPQARATKAKYRIDAFYDTEDKAKKQSPDKNITLSSKGSYIGKKIFEAFDVTKRFDNIKITDKFNYIFSRYEKLGVVGNNGTGKSTFIKMLLGEISPDSGYFDVGETVKFGYYCQDGITFDEQMKVIDAVQKIAEVIDLGNGNKLTASQFLQHFLFPPEKQHDFVYKLSGGEKRRLYLCTVLITNPNFLILDEPTNDLDIITLNILEEYLREFKGCLIVVSHDRFFMDKIVDHLLVFNGNADILDFPGNYSQFRDWKKLKEKQLDKVHNKEKVIKNTARSKPQEKIKLSYKEKLEFEQLESDIALLEEEKKELENQLSSGELSSETLFQKSNRIAEVIDSIDEKTLRWLELSEYA